MNIQQFIQFKKPLVFLLLSFYASYPAFGFTVINKAHGKYGNDDVSCEVHVNGHYSAGIELKKIGDKWSWEGPQRESSCKVGRCKLICRYPGSYELHGPVEMAINSNNFSNTYNINGTKEDYPFLTLEKE